jgi:hypothetical protein
MPVESERPPVTILRNTLGTPFTIAQLHDRVSMLDNRVILLREIVRGTPETMTVMGERILELGRRLDCFGLVIDLLDTDGSTTSEYRRFLPGCINGLHVDSKGKLLHIGVAFQGNLVTRTVTNFVVGRLVDAPISVHKSRADALGAVHRALAQGSRYDSI